MRYGRRYVNQSDIIEHHETECSKMKDCPTGILDYANQLIEKLEGELPQEYKLPELSYLEIIASIRHEHTNYEQLLYELSEWKIAHCPVYLLSGELHQNCEIEQCKWEELAHDILKAEAKRLAIRLLRNNS